MGLHNDIATALANRARLVSGMHGASPKPVDTLPGTPYTVVGPPQGQMLAAGSWERLLLTFPMRCYVARVDSSDRVQAQVSDFLDTFLTDFRTGITLGGLVSEAILRSWNTNVFYTLGGTDWQAIDFSVGVELNREATYTA